MTKKTLKIARQRAKQFIERVKTLEDKIEEDRHALQGCTESGAVKRASMDLTRALAELRKP